MADNLLPCPFCGGDPHLMHCGAATYMMQCLQCKATTDDGSLDRISANWNRRAIPPSIRDFLGKMQGVCMGVAMSGRDHPNPDGALMELFNEAQAILFPPAYTGTLGMRDKDLRALRDLLQRLLVSNSDGRMHTYHPRNFAV